MGGSLTHFNRETVGRYNLRSKSSLQKLKLISTRLKRTIHVDFMSAEQTKSSGFLKVRKLFLVDYCLEVRKLISFLCIVQSFVPWSPWQSHNPQNQESVRNTSKQYLIQQLRNQERPGVLFNLFVDLTIRITTIRERNNSKTVIAIVFAFLS